MIKSPCTPYKLQFVIGVCFVFIKDSNRILHVAHHMFMVNCCLRKYEQHYPVFDLLRQVNGHKETIIINESLTENCYIRPA